MKKYLFITIALFCANVLFAQTKNVTGTITGQEGKALKGVRFEVIDANIFAKSDKKGTFTLKKVETGDSVSVMVNRGEAAKFLIGDAIQLQLKVDGKTLAIDKGNGSPVFAMFETVAEEERANGSVVTAKMIQRNNYQNLKDVLKAFIPGMSIQTTANGETVSNIRGVKSLNLSSEPLVIVDGVEMDLTSANSSCNVYDIDRIEVNKDGMGYGIKGANGVIIIKTKR